MKILFVCSGNICRSPMAAEYLRHRAARSRLTHVVVDSAGTLGIEGEPASAEAIRTLREAGLDLAPHRSKGVCDAAFRSSDLVLAMAQEHLEFLSTLYADSGAQLMLFRAFERGAQPSPGAPDLPDPIGRSIEFYRSQFVLIRTCVDHLVLHLRHLSVESGDP